MVSPTLPESGLRRRHVVAVTLGNALEFHNFLTYSFFAIQIGHAFSRPTICMRACPGFGLGHRNSVRSWGGAVPGACVDGTGRAGQRRPGKSLSSDEGELPARRRFGTRSEVEGDQQAVARTRASLVTIPCGIICRYIVIVWQLMAGCHPTCDKNAHIFSKRGGIILRMSKQLFERGAGGISGVLRLTDCVDDQRQQPISARSAEFRHASKGEVMNRRMNVIRAFLYGSVAAVSLSAPAALAQEQSIETVVVTASKRSEDIQKVPFSVTALTAKDLIARGAGSVEQASTMCRA